MKWTATDLGLVIESPPVISIVACASEYALVLPAALNVLVPPFGMLMAVIPLTSRDGLTTAFAVFSNQDGIITIQNVQGVGSTRLEGMLAYPIHDA